MNYTAAGDQLPTQLSTAVQGGNPPDIAALPQPGLMTDFVNKNALQPLDFAKSDIEDNFGQSVVDLGTVDGKLYGFLFKAANKSLVWYNVGAYSDAGVSPADDGTRGSRTVTRSQLPVPPRTRSAAPTGGRSPTSSKTSTSGRPGRRSTTSSPRMTSRGRTSPSRTR